MAASGWRRRQPRLPRPHRDGVGRRPALPLIVSAEVAAGRIKRGLDRGHDLIAFPRRLLWLIRAGRLLPWRLRAALGRSLRFETLPGGRRHLSRSHCKQMNQPRDRFVVAYAQEQKAWLASDSVERGNSFLCASDSGISNMARLRSACGFAAILAASLAGAFHLTAWTICATAATLVLVSLNQHHGHYSRYAGQGNLGAQSMLLLGSTLNAATAATVAFALGRAIGWLWGV